MPCHAMPCHAICYAQALNDNVTTFTRAAGAAERVLSLYDLTPDIDCDKAPPSHVH